MVGAMSDLPPPPLAAQPTSELKPPSPAAGPGWAPPPVPVRSGADASPKASWPITNKQVTVQGRQMSVEIVLVAGVYAACALWLLISLRDLFSVIPDLFSGLFEDNSLLFLISWVLLMIISLLLYLVFGMAAISYLLLRVDPLGRALTVVVAANLVAMLVTSSEAAPGALVVITIAACACAAVLFMSPWVRRSFNESPLRRGQPAPVVLAISVAVAFYSMLAWVALIGLPGLRFAGDLGAEFIMLLASYFVSVVLVFKSVRVLRKGKPDRSARLQLSIGCAVTVLGAVIGGDSSGSVAFLLSVVGSIVGSLWLAPSAREWFGDAPLSSRDTAV